MAIKSLYSIKDNKASTFSDPQPSNNAITAMREVSTVVQDSKTMLSKFSEDFDLYHVGDFDTNTGKFIQPEQPEFVIACVALRGQTAVENDA